MMETTETKSLLSLLLGKGAYSMSDFSVVQFSFVITDSMIRSLLENLKPIRYCFRVSFY